MKLLTEKEEVFIACNYLTMPVKRMAATLGRSSTGVKGVMNRLNLIVPAEIINQRKNIGRFKKGSSPATKGKKQSEYMSKEGIARCSVTRFKKGDKPHNQAEKDGAISIRKSNSGNRAYKFIRISLGNWYPLHQLIWQQANGIVPPGYCLWFIDGNTMNCELSNLEMITRAENADRNKSKFNALPEELKQVIKLTHKLSKKINQYTKNEKQN